MSSHVEKRPSDSKEMPGSWDVFVSGELVARCVDRWTAGELQEVLMSAYALTAPRGQK